MSVTQGITERPVDVAPESLGPWINRELLPLLRQLRAEVNAIPATFPPSGAAGGDLAGTYPDPNVAAVHETSGPTKLTVGAIADGQFVKRSGAGLVGETVSSVAPVTLRGHRHEDQGGAYVSGTTRIHIAGLNNISAASAYIGGGTTAALQGIGTGQMAYAIPDCFERAVTINRLVVRTNGRVGTGGTAKVKLSVYEESSLSSGSFSGSPYPGDLLGSSGDIDIDTSANVLGETSGLSISIPAGSRVWFVWTCTDQVVTNVYTIPTYRGGTLFPILGFIFDPGGASTIVTDDATRGVGWRHAVTYTGSEAMPNPFPQTSPVVLTGADQVLPCVGFGQVIV